MIGYIVMPAFHGEGPDPHLGPFKLVLSYEHVKTAVELHHPGVSDYQVPVVIEISDETVREMYTKLCNHQWVDARDEVVLSGEMCILCGAIRPSSHDV